MATACNECGANLTENDKFCGDCGTPVVAPPSPMQAAPKPATLQTSAPAKSSKGLILGLILGGIFLGGAGSLAAIGYYSGWFDRAGASSEVSEPAPASIASAEPDLPNPALKDVEPTETPEPVADEVAKQPTSNSEDTQSSGDSYVIEPGKWVYNSEVIAAVLVNTRTPAMPNGRTILGHKNRYEVCVSKKQAMEPSKQLLVPPMGSNCTHGRTTMEGGEYQSEMLCTQKSDGQRYTVRINGGYERKEIQLATDANIEINQGPNGVDGRAMSSLTASVVGKHVGPC